MRERGGARQVEGRWDNEYEEGTHLALLLELDLEVVLVTRVRLHLGAVETLQMARMVSFVFKRTVRKEKGAAVRKHTHLDVIRDLLRARELEHRTHRTTSLILLHARKRTAK